MPCESREIRDKQKFNACSSSCMYFKFVSSVKYAQWRMSSFFFYTYPVETPSGGIGGLVICMISGSCVVLQLFLCYLFQFRLII